MPTAPTIAPVPYLSRLFFVVGLVTANVLRKK
jgi:hypothetical protein